MTGVQTCALPIYIGPDRLYCLTVMVPNEGFAEMIRAGSTQSLDEADEAVISAA